MMMMMMMNSTYVLRTNYSDWHSALLCVYVYVLNIDLSKLPGIANDGLWY